MKNIEIRQIKKLANKVLRATIAFNTSEFGVLVVKGVRVSASPKFEGIWVQPPSFNTYGHYHPIFFLENKALWSEICHQLEEVYKNYIDQLGEEIEVDLDDLASQINID